MTQIEYGTHTAIPKPFTEHELWMLRVTLHWFNQKTSSISSVLILLKMIQTQLNIVTSRFSAITVYSGLYQSHHNYWTFP